MNVKSKNYEKVLKSIVFIIFMLYALSLLFPFVWMLLNSFKERSDFISNIWGLPVNFQISNYYDALIGFQIQSGSNKYNIFEMFLNSVFVTAVGTFLSIGFSTCSAYVVSKYKFPGSKILYAISIFTLIFPVVGTLPSQYRIMQTLGLQNSHLGLFILYSGAFGFNFFMMHGFFKSISWTYAEAAYIDGATDFQIFTKIMVPLAKPSITALAVIQAIALWNDYVNPSIYLRKFPTLAVGLNQIVAEMQGKGAYPEMFAAMIIALLPILILFIIFQKQIMDNMQVGGIK